MLKLCLSWRKMIGNYFKNRLSQVSRGRMLNEFRTLMSNHLLTWEEQNELYKTIIEYIDYKYVENSLTIEIKFK